MLVQERLVREVLSGPNTGAAFAVATNGIASGLIESGVTHDNYGAAVTDFGRDDILTWWSRTSATRTRAAGEMVWIISTDLEKAALGHPRRRGRLDALRR